MIQFNSIFNFEFLCTESPKGRFLIGTSSSCCWCEEFKDNGIWESIEEGVKDDYEVCMYDVGKIGGPQLVVDAFLYFLKLRVPVAVGYPALYVASKDEIKEVATEVYWDRDNERFKTEGLIEYLLNQRTK